MQFRKLLLMRHHAQSPCGGPCLPGPWSVSRCPRAGCSRRRSASQYTPTGLWARVKQMARRRCHFFWGNTQVIASIYGHSGRASGYPFNGGYSFNTRVPVQQPGTRVPGTHILDEYEVLPVPVTGISKPGNTGEYPGKWRKGNTSIMV